MLLHVLIEEPSARLVVQSLVSRLRPDLYVQIHAHSGKKDLLRKIEGRLRAFARHRPQPYVMILIDRDAQDCSELKATLDSACEAAGLVPKSRAHGQDFSAVNRIAVEELEAWFLGDEAALCAAYPRLATYAERKRFRNPDDIKGGTWEALEQLLQEHRYYLAGLNKSECAELVAPHLDPMRNRSRSFQVFVEGLRAFPKPDEIICDE